MAEDRMLSDEILLGIINSKSGGGGGGGTSNYNDLSNKPQIAGTTLQGNKTLSDLGIASASALANKVDKVAGKGLSTNDYSNEDKAIVGGVTAALADKVDKVDGKGLSSNDFTDAYKTAIGDNTTAISGIKNGEGINSFGGVESALALKQDKTDNNLQTTDKTVVGAVNELKSGLTNVESRIEAVESNDFYNGEINIKTYNTSENKYTFPTSGYIIAPQSETDIICTIFGSTNNYTYFTVRLNTRNPLFVRKGMRCYVSSNAGDSDIYFTSLI